MKSNLGKKEIFNFLVFLSVIFLLGNLCGCESFVRKFTRKPKTEDKPREDLVLEPEEYKGPNLTKEQLYRKYLGYWKSWQDELITAFLNNGTYKKRVDCIEQAIKNLEQLRKMLNPDKQKIMDDYLNRMQALKDRVVSDVYGVDMKSQRTETERLRMGILKDLSYHKVKDSFI
jgi:hypothetical protein